MTVTIIIKILMIITIIMLLITVRVNGKIIRTRRIMVEINVVQ